MAFYVDKFHQKKFSAWKTCQNFLRRDCREGCFDPIWIGLAQDTPPARAASSQNTPISRIQIQMQILP